MGLWQCSARIVAPRPPVLRTARPLPDNAAMHLLIPFACSHADGCRAALASLELPHLRRLLARLVPGPLEKGDEFSLSPPHERALARALGLPLQDGLLPWAALRAQDAGLSGEDWALLTLCHWQVGSHQIMMEGRGLGGLSEADSRALLADMSVYFAEDGIRLHYLSPTQWLASGSVLANLPTASPDQVAGRDVSAWLPEGAAAATLRRLQAEMQMLLYQHPINDARAQARLAPVNAFWLSGTGALDPAAPRAPAPEVLDSLREPALQEDWAAWARAWQALEAAHIAPLLAARAPDAGLTLTLCGERLARSWTTQRQPIWRKLMNQIRHQPLMPLLEQL
jgi:hypothetical protein